MLSKADVKYINSLQNKKYRKIERAFLVEGLKNVEELLKSDYKIKRLFCTESYAKTFSKSFAQIEVLSANELTKLGTLENNTTALAVAEIKELANLPTVTQHLILVLDGLNDPGNLGTIIRIADWYGVKEIVCSPDTVDFYNPKVINSSKGSFTRVNVHYTQLDTFLSEVQLPILASCMNGTSIYNLANQLPCVLLMGNEAKGIHKDLLKMASKEIGIPRIGNAESLNVGVATGILIDRLLN